MTTRYTRRDALKLSSAALLSHALPALARTEMLTRAIPASDEPLPVIGLGTYSVFDVAGSDTEIDARQQIVRALFTAGGSVIDTSPMYNRSEAVIGQVLGADALTGERFLATKIWTDGAAAGQRQMKRSAALMGSDTIDLVQVHNRRDMSAHWPSIAEAQAAGFVRYNGVTDYRESALPAMMTIMEDRRPQFVQINYSLGERAADERLLPMAKDLGIAVLINRPFMSGRLFRAVANQTLPDWAAEFANSWGQFFLKFIVSHEAVTCVIPATSKLRHMVDNASAGHGPMPDTATRSKMVDFLKSV